MRRDDACRAEYNAGLNIRSHALRRGVVRPVLFVELPVLISSAYAQTAPAAAAAPPLIPLIGTTSSGPASPITANVGLVTRPPPARVITPTPGMCVSILTPPRIPSNHDKISPPTVLRPFKKAVPTAPQSMPSNQPRIPLRPFSNAVSIVLASPPQSKPSNHPMIAPEPAALRG